jgi:hypothetical protein
MKALGYIVINERLGNAGLLLTRDNGLWKGVPPKGILLYDEQRATTFPRRSLARAAIKRTRQHFTRLAVLEGRCTELAEDELTIRKLLPVQA